MADRRNFEEKHSDLPKRWRIKADLVNYIIRRYVKKLKQELELLKSKEIKLPSFFRDRRTDEEYVYDLVDGWLIEDIVCDAWLRERLIFRDKEIKVKHMGTNRDRTLQKYNPRKITTEPDFEYVTSKGKEVKVELQMARKAIKAGYDMKQSKVTRAEKNGHLFLWVIIPDDIFFIIEPGKDLKGISPTPNHLWGGKLVYHLPKERLNKIGMYNMVDEIPKDLYAVLGL